MLIPLELIQVQMDLMKLPPSVERFEKYVQVMTGGTGDLDLPLTAFNPMSKSHIKAVLEQMERLGFEDILPQAIERANRELKIRGDYRIGWVVADDIAGGWTCRETIEIDRATSLSAELKREMFSVIWWASDTPSGPAGRAQAEMQIYRSVALIDGPPTRTLEDYIKLEAAALRYADVSIPAHAKLDRVKMEKYYDATDLGLIVACFYGDAAAQKLGYQVLGFPENAGRMVATLMR